MVEAFVVLGVLGGLPARQHDDELVGDAHGVDHLVLGIAGVHVAAGEGDTGHCGVEVLELELAYLAAVHGVGEVAAEALHVEFVCAQTDFLVGIEAHADVAVLDFGMMDEIVHGRYDFGDACLVIGAEECVAVGDDDVLALVARQFGEVGRREGDARGRVEHDVAAVVVLDDAGSDVTARHVGRRIEVCDEAYSGHRGACGQIRRQCGEEIAVVVEGDVAESEFFEFAFEVFGELHLSGSGRGHIGEFVALGVELHILEKSVY